PEHQEGPRDDCRYLLHSVDQILDPHAPVKAPKGHGDGSIRFPSQDATRRKSIAVAIETRHINAARNNEDTLGAHTVGFAKYVAKRRRQDHEAAGPLIKYLLNTA